MDSKRLTRFGKVSLVALLAGHACGSLAAPPSEEVLQRLEAQIQALQDQVRQLRDAQAQQQTVQARQVQELKDQQAAQEKQIQAQVLPDNIPRLVESPTHQFGLASPDGNNSIALVARLFFDVGNYLHESPDGGLRGVGPGSPGNSLESGVNARRARFGVAGVFQGDWAYRLIYDLGSSADSTGAGVSGGVTSGVENAYFTYNGFYKKDNLVPVAIDAGYLDVPWTLEEAMSSNDIMFLERASPQVVATEFGGGDFRSAVGLRSNNKRYWAGLYLTGPTSGTPHHGVDTATYAVLGRASYQLVQAEDASLHLGANALHLFQPRASVTATTASSISTSASPVSSLALTDRPELRVDPTNILNTGAIPTDQATVLGAEAAAGWGNFFAQGEYFHYALSQYAGGVNPSDGAANAVSPTLNFDGFYVEASYSFGGRRRYIPETGAYSAVIPDQAFSLSGGGWGALELAARYSTINLNDHFTAGQPAHLTGGINGGEQTGIDVGLNWYPNVNMKLMVDYIHTDVSHLWKPVTTGKAPTALSGTTIDAIAGRLQFAY